MIILSNRKTNIIVEYNQMNLLMKSTSAITQIQYSNNAPSITIRLLGFSITLMKFALDLHINKL